MKVKSLLLALFTASILLSGCATDPEDKEFFERNWMHPIKREKGMEEGAPNN